MMNGFAEPEKNSIEQEEEDDDPVVHEIPVFLSQTLANNLYLFQVISQLSNAVICS